MGWWKKFICIGSLFNSLLQEASQAPSILEGLGAQVRARTKGSQKKASYFWTLSKRGLDPPLILDIHEVAFVAAHFGQL